MLIMNIKWKNIGIIKDIVIVMIIQIFKVLDLRVLLKNFIKIGQVRFFFSFFFLHHLTTVQQPVFPFFFFFFSFLHIIQPTQYEDVEEVAHQSKNYYYIFTRYIICNLFTIHSYNNKIIWYKIVKLL